MYPGMVVAIGEATSHNIELAKKKAVVNARSKLALMLETNELKNTIQLQMDVKSTKGKYTVFVAIGIKKEDS